MAVWGVAVWGVAVWDVAVRGVALRSGDVCGVALCRCGCMGRTWVPVWLCAGAVLLGVAVAEKGYGHVRVGCVICY
ncbi:jg24675 [Pararge aegeria aegeria]|uniref:Jg24675 protein n=1 Tax=Pararge aegeria aegeria TaxID=348720 RepID=A0A8S4QJB1_9NEOP|nr:jg24675 [Pararge aegeria aegeria]